MMSVIFPTPPDKKAEIPKRKHHSPTPKKYHNGCMAYDAAPYSIRKSKTGIFPTIRPCPSTKRKNIHVEDASKIATRGLLFLKLCSAQRSTPEKSLVLTGCLGQFDTSQTISSICTAFSCVIHVDHSPLYGIPKPAALYPRKDKRVSGH